MLSSLSLPSFRSYRDTVFSLGHATLITGANGSGKTHLLDALHWASGGSVLPDLLGVPESVMMHGYVDSAHYSAAVHREAGKTTYFFQGKKLSKPKYLELLPIRTVVFSPFDMNLAYLSPSLRRDYIDSILERAYAQFSATRREYERVLRQRNALLKSIRENGTDTHDLDFWDEKFSDIAERYLLYREKWIREIDENLHEIGSLLPHYTFHFHYTTKVDRMRPRESLLSYLREKRERDIQAGHTYIGPHLDDFYWSVSIAGKEYHSAEYLSRGENKMILLGMKYIEVAFLVRTTEKEIVLLFDDIFSELDAYHARSILERFHDNQMCITAQHIPSFLASREDFTCIDIENP